MGAIHNELNRGTISKAIKNALGVDTAEPGVERFGETLTPTFDIFSRPEWKLLRSERAFSRVVTSPAVAARLSTVQLRNPATTKVLAVVEAIWVTAGASMDIEIAVEQGDTAVGLNVTVQQGVSEDTRYNILGESSQCFLNTADVAVGIALPQLVVGTGSSGVRVTQILPVQFILNPNSKLEIFAKTVNTPFVCAVRWRERDAFVRELGVNP